VAVLSIRERYEGFRPFKTGGRAADDVRMRVRAAIASEFTRCCSSICNSLILFCADWSACNSSLKPARPV
jgi:hypothetical protein